jgi:hypothetical protein
MANTTYGWYVKTNPETGLYAYDEEGMLTIVFQLLHSQKTITVSPEWFNKDHVTAQAELDHLLISLINQEVRTHG